MKILVFVILETEMMRAIHDLKRAHFNRAVMKRNPRREALGISTHESIVLMCMNRQALAVRENQPPNRLRVYQEPVAYQHFHDSLKLWMVGQCVKRRQVKNLLVRLLKPRIGVATSRFNIGNAFEGIVARQQPARG